MYDENVGENVDVENVELGDEPKTPPAKVEKISYGEDDGLGNIPETPDTPETETVEVPEEFDPKRALGENKRKGEKITALEKEIAELKSKFETMPKPVEKQIDQLEAASLSPDVKKHIDRLKARGFDDEDISALLGISGYQSSIVLGSKLSPIENQFADANLSKATEELIQDEKYKYVFEKYGKEVKPFLIERKVALKDWGNPEVLRIVYGSLIAKHLEDFTKPQVVTKRIDREVLQEQSGNTGKTISGVSSAELKEYADDNGIDISDPVMKKKVVATLAARKRAMEVK